MVDIYSQCCTSIESFGSSVAIAVHEVDGEVTTLDNILDKKAK
jgi:hypothetical protein